MASFSSLLAQFRAQYPGGSLVSELSTVHNQLFVVRAMVQFGGVTLASGLAAEASIEAAEDHAKTRALEAFGLHLPSTPTSAPTASTGTSLVATPLWTPAQPAPAIAPLSPPPAPEMDVKLGATRVPVEVSLPPLPHSSAIAPLPEPLPESLPEPGPEPEPEPQASSVELTADPSWDEPLPEPPPELDDGPDFPDEEDAPIVADFYSHIAASSELDESEPVEDLSAIASLKRASDLLPEGTANSEAPAAKKPRRKSTELANSAPLPSPVSEPIVADSFSPATVDLSNIIAETSVELKRLGWSNSRGREHLKQTYGKRSRQELNEAELIEFLDYLKAQPSPGGSPI
ncbi:hypothetical protein ACQ4M4_21300 [Leptolyngbya sp. AN02str]|uniref:hypothetical protein n=1 Tax=Leptolyngbya sp. AN02str TaxID=3423363 RepID=UPI003D31F93E